MTTQAPQVHEFQAEVKQLLQIVIESLYSNKDVFLRELISNASDALDKLRFEGLTNSDLLPKDELQVRIERDTERRTLTVRDNGIGMNRAELEQNLGTIARSGTAEFLDAVRVSKGQVTPDLIGQFGVGFYASFMVADRVTVVTQKASESTASRWESAGEGSYTIADAARSEAGTTVTLHLKSVDGDNGIKDYTDEWVVREIVKHYSDFVSYPIKMKVRRQDADDDKEGGSAQQIVEQDETLNSMKAIWARNTGEVTDEEYNDFYKHIGHDWTEALAHVTAAMEGGVNARALMFIPSHAPLDLYHHEMSYRGLQLYVKRVFIMDECRDLMPTHLRFIKGVVDAEDLSLNVSREFLQQDRQITAIRKFLVRKIVDKLGQLMRDDPEKYQTFWTSFGPVLKEGLLSLEEKKEPLLNLMLVYTSNDPDNPTTLADYVGRMKTDQESIYYLTGSSRTDVRQSPHVELFLAKGYEVLFFTDAVDEIWLSQAPEYQDKSWRSVSRGDVDLGAADDKDRADADLKKQTDTHRDLLAALQNYLKDEVKEVRFSRRLTSSAACLVGETNELPPQLVEFLRRSGQDVPDTKQTLELNPHHAIVAKLQARYDAKKDDPGLADYAMLLYGQAVLAEGGQLKDPAEFSKRLAELMTGSL